jgi:RNA polymerase sigma factor (TIGR02999 family)
MSGPSTADVTRLLVAWQGGDEEALARLVPLVYRELHRLAHARLRAQQPAGATIQTTALVHEAYLRLVDAPRVACHDRAHFFTLCARAMRFILVDAARARGSLKRGGRDIRVAWRESRVVTPPFDVDLLALDEALRQLENVDPRKAKVVELRYFGGLSVDETAEALQVSCETVMRDWNTAKLWLLRRLRHTPEGELSGSIK